MNLKMYKQNLCRRHGDTHMRRWSMRVSGTAEDSPAYRSAKVADSNITSRRPIIRPCRSRGAIRICRMTIALAIKAAVPSRRSDFGRWLGRNGGRQQSLIGAGDGIRVAPPSHQSLICYIARMTRAQLSLRLVWVASWAPNLSPKDMPQKHRHGDESMVDPSEVRGRAAPHVLALRWPCDGPNNSCTFTRRYCPYRNKRAAALPQEARKHNDPYVAPFLSSQIRHGAAAPSIAMRDRSHLHRVSTAESGCRAQAQAHCIDRVGNRRCSARRTICISLDAMDGRRRLWAGFHARAACIDHPSYALTEYIC